VNRRDLLKSSVAGALGLWATKRIFARPLTDKIAVLDAGGANVVAFSASDGLVLVDSGAPNSVPGVSKVQTLFNTHYHLDQTGNNEMFAEAGAKIIAHERTRQWMSTDYWVPAEDRYEKARPKAAHPTEVFETTGSLKVRSEKDADEQIDYGYLLLAHTSGDIYVYFRTSNVLAVGDVASPERDPALDWFTGAWIGARVDAMDVLLKLANEQTKIVPAYGSVMTRAEFKAERDMMEEVRARLFKQVREADGPKEMLEAGVLNGLPRAWKDPNKFLYDAAKGLWAHHDKLDPNVV
jgi:glyoxylase-like metal-dependent hydrolase (beta-lactamase superfamily II)